MRKVTKEVPSATIPYGYLTGKEQEEINTNEINKAKDPCEKDLECNQDKENRYTTGEQDTPGELNWTHKNEIAEAEGININPNRKWTPGFTPEDSKPETKQEEKTTKEIQEPKHIYTGKENPEIQTQQTTDPKKQKYNPEEALKKSIQERAAKLPKVRRIKEGTSKNNAPVN